MVLFLPSQEFVICFKTEASVWTRIVFRFRKLLETWMRAARSSQSFPRIVSLHPSAPKLSSTSWAFRETAASTKASVQSFPVAFLVTCLTQTPNDALSWVTWQTTKCWAARLLVWEARAACMEQTRPKYYIVTAAAWVCVLFRRTLPNSLRLGSAAAPQDWQACSRRLNNSAVPHDSYALRYSLPVSSQALGPPRVSF